MKSCFHSYQSQLKSITIKKSIHTKEVLYSLVIRLILLELTVNPWNAYSFKPPKGYFLNITPFWVCLVPW